MELIVSFWIVDLLALSPSYSSGVYNLSNSTGFSVGRFKNTLRPYFLEVFLCRSLDYSCFFCLSNRFNPCLSRRSRYACGLQALFHHLCPYFQYYILWQFEVFTGYQILDFCFLALRLVQFFVTSRRVKSRLSWFPSSNLVEIISLLWRSVSVCPNLASPLLPSTVSHNGRLCRMLPQIVL